MNLKESATIQGWPLALHKEKLQSGDLWGEWGFSNRWCWGGIISKESMQGSISAWCFRRWQRIEAFVTRFLTMLPSSSQEKKEHGRTDPMVTDYWEATGIACCLQHSISVHNPVLICIWCYCSPGWCPRFFPLSAAHLPGTGTQKWQALPREFTRGK